MTGMQAPRRHGAHRGDAAAYLPVIACHLHTYRHTPNNPRDGTSTAPKQQAGQRVPPAAAIPCHTEHAVAFAATQAGVQEQHQQSSSMRTTASESQTVRGHEQTGQRSNAGGSSTSTGVSARKGWARSHLRQWNGGQGEAAAAGGEAVTVLLGASRANCRPGGA